MSFYITGEECYCRDWHGCIMQQSIVGMENIQPYKFSDCSLNDYIEEFRDTRNMCLLNKPNEVNFLHTWLVNRNTAAVEKPRVIPSNHISRIPRILYSL